MPILSFSLRMSMEVRRRQAGQVQEGTLRYSLNRLFQVGRQGSRGSVTEARIWTNLPIEGQWGPIEG
jgi:hypothetical protein